jgi:hypothetical protein
MFTCWLHMPKNRAEEPRRRTAPKNRAEEPRRRTAPKNRAEGFHHASILRLSIPWRAAIS